MRTSKGLGYENFKKFLNDIDSGKTPQIITEKYIIISRKEYDEAQRQWHNYIQTQQVIYSKVN